ncbi:MAG: hypothetical protein K2M06_05055 [Muribaculaceae bacterium]|nr:hypothetical protein [Muribaculaceae bacterium]
MKFNKIFSVLACTALLACSYACTDHVEPTPSPSAGNQEAYFPVTESAELSIPVDATMVSLKVNRIDATEESTVGLTSSVMYVDDTDEENPVEVKVEDIFTIPSSVTFPKGVKEITLEIGVDFEKVEMDREYNIDLTLDANYTGAYGMGHRTFVAVYLPWSDWELYSEVEPGVYQMGALWDYEYNTPVYVRESLNKEGVKQYLVLSPFTDFEYEEVIELDPSKTIDVDGVECPLVKLVEPINTPIVNTNYGETYSYTTILEYLMYYYEGGGQFTEAEALKVMANNGFELSYFNPVQGRFYLNMYLYSATKMFGPALETLQLPGEYKDYYFNFAYQGNLVSDDYEVKEYAIVEVVPSPDIDHFVCEIQKGELAGDDLDAAYDALASDEDAEYIYAGSYKMSYEFSESGRYTTIAVGYDKDNKVVAKGAKIYTFESKQVTPEWTTIGYADYTDGLFVGLLLNANGIATWEVMVQEHNDMPGYYRIANPYGEWPLLEDIGWPLLDGKYYIEIDARDPKGVLMPLSAIGIDLADIEIEEGVYFGPANAMSDAWFQINYKGSTLTAQKRAGATGTFENDHITFPAGKLLLMTDEGDGFYTNLDPNRPQGKPVTYGKGMFDLDFSPMAGAPSKKISPNVKGLNSIVTLKSLAREKSGRIKVQKMRCGHDLSQDKIREMMSKNSIKF